MLGWQAARLTQTCWRDSSAATSRGVVVACGHTATVGWLRSRTDTFHSDVQLLEAVPPAAAAPGSAGGLRWVQLSAGGDAD